MVNSKLIKFLSLVVAIMFIASMFFGCGDNSSAKPVETTKAAAQEQTKAETKSEVIKAEITFWNGFTGPDGPTLQALVDKYNSESKVATVKMEIMPWDSLYQKLTSTIATSQGPDIVAFSSPQIGTYAKPGAIVPVDEAFTKGVDLDVIPKGLVDILKYNDKFYAVPMNFATLMLYYNKDLFAKANLDPNKPPEDWNQLADYAKKLTKVNGANVEQYGFGIASKETVPMWPILIWGNGGDIIDYKNMKSVVNSDKTIGAVQLFADLIIKDKVSPPVLKGAEVDKLFETQKCAMYMCGPWAVEGFKKAGINFGVAPVPQGPERKVTLGDSVVMVMTKNCENKDAAYDYFKFWNSKDAQITWSLKTGFPPARTDLVNDEQLKSNSYVVAFSSQANDAQFYLQKLTNFGQIDSDVLSPAYEKILLGKASVKDALDEAAKKMDELLKNQ
ncbi:MAG: hypothetical protein A2Y21_01340 [Clostridiales bacterium GWC2_40_7]|nr:MAG: hypothetical protein A2Y21_01340 [Clostridiales bacterium GWC2_40_7]